MLAGLKKIQVTLFKALQSIKIEDDKATAIVDTLEGFIEMRISQATAPILTKLDAIDAANKARFDSLGSSIANQKWAFGAIVATIGIVLSLLNYSHVHA